jgi:hypothetical protein
MRLGAIKWYIRSLSGPIIFVKHAVRLCWWNVVDGSIYAPLKRRKLDGGGLAGGWGLRVFGAYGDEGAVKVLSRGPGRLCSWPEELPLPLSARFECPLESFPRSRLPLAGEKLDGCWRS